MDRALNARKVDSIPAVAVRGEGVLETFSAILMRTIQDLAKRYSDRRDQARASPLWQWTQQAVLSMFGTTSLGAEAHTVADELAATRPALLATVARSRRSSEAEAPPRCRPPCATLRRRGARRPHLRARRPAAPAVALRRRRSRPRRTPVPARQRAPPRSRTGARRPPSAADRRAPGRRARRGAPGRAIPPPDPPPTAAAPAPEPAAPPRRDAPRGRGPAPAQGRHAPLRTVVRVAPQAVAPGRRRGAVRRAGPTRAPTRPSSSPTPRPRRSSGPRSPTCGRSATVPGTRGRPRADARPAQEVLAGKALDPRSLPCWRGWPRRPARATRPSCCRKARIAARGRLLRPSEDPLLAPPRPAARHRGRRERNRAAVPRRRRQPRPGRGPRPARTRPSPPLLAVPVRTPRGLLGLADALLHPPTPRGPAKTPWPISAPWPGPSPASLELAATLETVRGAERALEMALAGTASVRGLEDVVNSLLELRERLGLMRRRPGAPPGSSRSSRASPRRCPPPSQAGRSLLAFNKGEIQQDTIALDELLAEVAERRRRVQIRPGRAVCGDAALLRLALRALVEQAGARPDDGHPESAPTPRRAGAAERRPHRAATPAAAAARGLGPGPGLRPADRRAPRRQPHHRERAGRGRSGSSSPFRRARPAGLGLRSPCGVAPHPGEEREAARARPSRRRRVGGAGRVRLGPIGPAGASAPSCSSRVNRRPRRRRSRARRPRRRRARAPGGVGVRMRSRRRAACCRAVAGRAAADAAADGRWPFAPSPLGGARAAEAAGRRSTSRGRGRRGCAAASAGRRLRRPSGDRGLRRVAAAPRSSTM